MFEFSKKNAINTYYTIVIYITSKKYKSNRFKHTINEKIKKIAR